MNIEQLRARLEEIETERRNLHTAAGTSALTDEQQTRWDELDTEETEVRESLRVAEETETRRRRVEESRARWGSTNVNNSADRFAPVHGDSTEARQARVSSLIRANEGRIESAANQAHFERIIKRHAKHADWANNLIARSRPEYARAFSKLMMGQGMLLSDEERAAIAVGTNTQGGFLVPTFLDPSLILSNTGTANAVRPLSRVVTQVVGNTWHGVSTAGVTAGFGDELSEATDNSPDFAGPSVELHMAKAFVKASFEAFEDIETLADDVMMLFADARDILEGAKHCTGSGTGEPWGVFTAINGNTNQQVTSTTAATIGLADLQKVYRTLGRRFRNKSTWVLNPLYLTAIQALGTALSASYTTNLGEALTDVLIGRPVVDTDDAPTTQTTTALDNEVLLGDFSNFVIADKPGGMSVEFVPILTGTTANLPNGTRGWLAHWRTGSDSVNDAGFELLVDKTTA